MKRILLLAFALSASLCAGISLDYLEPTEFAFYRDTRGGIDFMRGYWYIRGEDGTEVVFIRSIDLKDRSERLYALTLIEDENGLPKIKALRGVEKDERPEHRQAIVDFLNYTHLYLAREDDIAWDSTIEDPWETYTLLFSFSRALPFFAFSDIRLAEALEPNYVLEYAGLADYEHADKFLKSRLEPIEAVSIPSPPPELRVDGLRAQALGPFQVELDARWKRNAAVGVDGYWLEARSFRDSQIALEEANEVVTAMIEANPARPLKLNLLAQGLSVDYSSVRCSELEDGVLLFFSNYDEKRVRNIQYLAQRKIEGRWWVVNLSSFEDIHDRNLGYYERILKSVR